MNRKLIAPILIGVIISLYFILWLYILFHMETLFALKIILIIFITGLLFLWIHVVKERLREIREGEEDDLGKY